MNDYYESAEGVTISTERAKKEIENIVEEYLNESTMIVAKLDNGNFVYAQF